MRTTSRRDTVKLGAAGLAGAMLAGRPGGAIAGEPPVAASGHVITYRVRSGLYHLRAGILGTY
jgi:hypothetical protein